MHTCCSLEWTGELGCLCCPTLVSALEGSDSVWHWLQRQPFFRLCSASCRISSLLKKVDPSCCRDLYLGQCIINNQMEILLVLPTIINVSTFLRFSSAVCEQPSRVFTPHKCAKKYIFFLMAASNFSDFQVDPYNLCYRCPRGPFPQCNRAPSCGHQCYSRAEVETGRCFLGDCLSNYRTWLS